MGHCLILISCSNHKKEGGKKEYSVADSILEILNSKTREDVLNKREEIFNLIKEEKMKDLLRGGGKRADDPNNDNLQNGPDISNEVEAFNGLYMPAYKRYEGKFFKKAKRDAEDVFERAISHEHHTLIVSGLYGLITLREPIQLYACHMDDSVLPMNRNAIERSRVSDLWRELINETLFQYIDHHNKQNIHKISKVIDLLSEYSYQRIFQWEQLSAIFKDDGIKVYHRVVPGIKEPDFLTDLGKYYRKEIVGDVNDFKTPLDQGGDIYFTEELQPDPYFMQKLKGEMTENVWKRLDKKSQKELIQAENLYHIFMARPGVGLDDKADSNMHYFNTVENELQLIFSDITRKDGSMGLGSIGDYKYHLERNTWPMLSRLSFSQDLKKYLRIAHKTRNDAAHREGITKAQLIRAREILLGERGRKGLFAMLMDIKSFKNPHSSFQK